MEKRRREVKVIVGLGNPGEQYRNTRHNVGYRVLDKIVEQIRSFKFEVSNDNLKFRANKKFKSEVVKMGELVLVKPQTFMNKSGLAVREVVNFYQVSEENLWVVHDDLDIKLGEYKIQLGRGPKEHKGVLSIERELGEKSFWRARIGIENRVRGSGFKIEGEEYVLMRFSEEEGRTVDEVIDGVVVDLRKRLMD
jgi:PTH1 family peptidyl-tRNA hydrolase